MRLNIDARYRGPDHSGNGGYSAGRFAQLLRPYAADPIEVTLRAPPPLNTPLTVHSSDGWRLCAGEQLILEGRPGALDQRPPACPDLGQALASTSFYRGYHDHHFPECFVCGPKRAHGDGLRIFTGRTEPGQPVCAPWVPHASLFDNDGFIEEAVLWAALDCPGYFAVAEPGELAVLGRMTACFPGTIRRGEICTIVGWALGRDGRKLHAGTALYGDDARLIGQSQQTWIQISPAR